MRFCPLTHSAEFLYRPLRPPDIRVRDSAGGYGIFAKVILTSHLSGRTQHKRNKSPTRAAEKIDVTAHRYPANVTAYANLKSAAVFFPPCTNRRSGAADTWSATLETSLWCMERNHSFRSCLLEAFNLGEDTEAVGAVVGGTGRTSIGEE